jgi:hypothetical protein
MSLGAVKVRVALRSSGSNVTMPSSKDYWYPAVNFPGYSSSEQRFLLDAKSHFKLTSSPTSQTQQCPIADEFPWG